MYNDRSRLCSLLVRQFSILFAVCLVLLISPASIAAQSSGQIGLPVIFVHGFCDSADSFLPLEQSVKSSVMQNGQGLYGSSNEWVAFYDGSNVWFQIPETELTAGSADPPISPQKLKSIDPGARFFLVALDDPPQSDYRNFNPNLVADVPIASKGNELAHIIWAIKSITGAPRVILVTHSMGGLDAREYIENLADATFDNDVAALVTLDTPHGGAALTNLPSLPNNDWAQCFANDSPDKEEMNPSSQVMQILNYQSGNASPLPLGLTITSIKSYWTIPASGAMTIWGTDDVLTSDEQDLEENLNPNAAPKSVLASADDPFPSPFLTPASGLFECGVDDFLHLLPCTGDASQTITTIDNAVQPYAVMQGGQIQILPAAPSVSPGSNISLSAQIPSGGPAIWTILEGAYGGTITQGGVYTAPPNSTGGSETFHIVAIDSHNPSQYGEIPVEVTASTEKATTTTVLSTSSPQVVEGMSVPLTATVQSGGGSPTGTITFYDGTNAINSPIAINGGGIATYTANGLALGFHSITARYSGDANNTASVSAAVTITVTTDDPQLTVLPSSGTADVTQFTKYDTGFAPNGLITHTVTLPDQSQSVKQTYADSSGSGSYSVVYTEAGTYTQVDTDVTSGNQTAPVSWTVTEPVVNDFSLQVSPTTGSVTQSGTLTVGVSTTTIGGTSQNLTLGVLNLPTGVTASFAPASITSGQTSALTFSASTAATPGLYTVTVVAAGSTSNHSVSFSLNVTPAPTGPAVSLTPPLVQFNSQAVGTMSNSETVRLMNSGSGTLQVNSIALAAGSDYVLSLPSGTFPLLLNSLVPYNLQVSFAPTTTGLRNGQIVIYDNAPDSPQVVQLSGTGTAPEPSTGTINVNATLNGTPLPAGTNIFEYTLSGPSTYSGVAAYSFSVTPGTYSVAFSGVPNYLTLASVTPSTSQSVAAGGTVTFTLNFTAPNDFYPPEFLSAPGGITPQLVSGGSTASYTVGLGVPPGNAAVPITLTVAGVPPGATATFNPEPVNDNESSALTIATGTAQEGVYSLSLSGSNSSGLTHADPVGGTSTLGITAPPSVPVALVSADSTGEQLNAMSSIPPAAASSDGRYIVFATSASNLTGSINGISEVFVRDVQLGTTIPVSVSATGTLANNASYPGGISADGSLTVFASVGDNLPDSVSGETGIYLRDLRSGTTSREDVASDGSPANGNAGGLPCISANGRFIVFGSNATNLVSGVGGTMEMYERDLTTGQIALVSIADDGTPANSGAQDCAVSADGRFVVFSSASSNLVSVNTNGTTQVFIHDMLTGKTSLVSVSDGGAPAGFSVDDNNTPLSISADGRYVVFGTNATNLVPQTVNSDQEHLFQRDILGGHTTQIDVDSIGTPLGGGSDYTEASQSGDGRFVAFHGLGQTLIRDTVAKKTQIISLASDGTPGNTATYNCCSPAEVTAGGRSVVFDSAATNLVANDTNGVQDTFIAQNPFVSSPYLQSVVLSPGSVIGGNNVTCTVTLSGPAPVGGATVALTSNDSSVAQVPAIVFVPEGVTTGTIDLQTIPVSTETLLTITASYNGGSSAVVLATEPGAILSIDPPASDFGYQAVGTASSSEPITITNSGTATLMLNSIQLASGTSFSASQNTCGSAVVAGNSCSVSVTFKPTVSGSVSDTLQISYGNPASVQSVNLSGIGALAAALLSPTSLNFGSSVVFVTNEEAVTLSNNGTAELSGISASISGQNSGDFSLAGDGCTGVLLPANTSCSMTIAFTPKGTGQRQANLLVADSATGSPQTVTLSGSATAIAPTVTVQPSLSSITTAQSFSVTVTVASGGNPTPTGSVTLSSGSYTSAAATLSGGAATISVPAGALSEGTDVLTGTYSGDSTYTAATGSTSVTVTPAESFALSASPSTISVAQGSSASSTITITPSGGFSGTVSLAATGLPNGITLSFVAGSQADTQVLSLTASTAATVTSSPANLTITGTSGTLSSSTTIALTVTAEPGFTAGSGGTTSISLSPGATTGNTGTISVVGTNDFSGTVSLKCAVTTSMAGVNYKPTCSLNPTSLAISGTAAATSTLSVATTAPSSAKNNLRRLFGPSAGGASLALLLLFTVPARRRKWLSMLGLFVICALVGVTGCGGGGNGGISGGGGSGGNPGTTLGTYTITVTGTSGSVSATVGTITLTVQ